MSAAPLPPIDMVPTRVFASAALAVAATLLAVGVTGGPAGPTPSTFVYAAIWAAVGVYLHARADRIAREGR